MAQILPPHVFDAMVHKAFSSPVRKEILMIISDEPKYLSQISEEVKKKPQTVDFHLKVLLELDIVKSSWIEGKKYYTLKDKNIIKFLKNKNPMIPHFQSKPPHEIVEEAMKKILKKLDSIEKRLIKLEKK